MTDRRVVEVRAVPPLASFGPNRQSAPVASANPILRPAYYAATTSEFRSAAVSTVIGQLTRNSAFAVEPPQVTAWQREIEILQSALAAVDGHVFLEFDVPRLGTRIDAVVLAGAALIPIEFKVGAKEF